MMKTILRDVMDSFQQKVDSRVDKIEGMVNAMQNEACYDYGFDGADQTYYNDGWVYADGTHHTHDISEDEAENTEDEEPPPKKSKTEPAPDKSPQPDSGTARLLNKVKQKYGVKEGQQLDDNIVDVVKTALTQTLTEEEMTSLTEKYDTPKNCGILTQVKVNQLIWDKLDAPVRSSDLRLQKVQGFVVKSITAIARLMEKVLKHEQAGDDGSSAEEILDIATDALSLAGVANMEINNRRKEQIKHNLSDDYKGLCSSSAPVTTELFGDDVTKQVKDLAEASKVGRKLANKPKTTAQRGRGMWRGRPRGPFMS